MKGSNKIHFTCSKSLIYVNWRMFRHLYNIFKPTFIAFVEPFQQVFRVETVSEISPLIPVNSIRQMKCLVCLCG